MTIENWMTFDKVMTIYHKKTIKQNNNNNNNNNNNKTKKTKNKTKTTKIMFLVPLQV